MCCRMSEENTDKAYHKYRKVRGLYRVCAAEAREKHSQLLAAKRVAEALAAEYEALNTKRFNLSLAVESSLEELEAALKADDISEQSADEEEDAADE